MMTQTTRTDKSRTPDQIAINRAQSHKDRKTFALEVAERELIAIQEGKIDPMFIAYTLRQVRQALAV